MEEKADGGVVIMVTDPPVQGVGTDPPVHITIQAKGLDAGNALSEDMDMDAVDPDHKPPSDHTWEDGEPGPYRRRTTFPDEPFPDSFTKLSKLTVIIGPVRLFDLGNGELPKVLNIGHSFEFKFEEPVRKFQHNFRHKHDKQYKDKFGHLSIPIVCRTPNFLLHVTDVMSRLKVGEREMIVEYPDEFNDTLDDVRAYVDRVRKLRMDYSVSLQKRRLIIRDIPDDVTLEKIQSLFPEAKTHLIRYKKVTGGEEKPHDVKMEFETEEATQDFFERHTDNMMIDDHTATLFFPYKELQERHKVKEEENGTATEKTKPARVKKKPNKTPQTPPEPKLDPTTLEKRQLIIRDVPDDITIEGMKSLFPEAKKHAVKRRKDKPVNVRLEFESEEAAQEFYNKRQDSIMIAEKKRTLNYPYLERQPKKKNPIEAASGLGKVQEKRKLGVQQQKTEPYPSKQPRRGSYTGTGVGRGMGNYAQMQRQQRQMQDLQMRQRMVLSQSGGMGGGNFGAGSMNQGNQGWNYQSGYGNTGVMGSSPYSVGNGFSNQNQNQNQTTNQNTNQNDGDDAMSMMASLKSTLANIEKKIMTDGTGDRNRKGGNQPGNYGGSSNENFGSGGSSYTQNVGGSGYTQNPGQSSYSQGTSGGFNVNPNQTASNYGIKPEGGASNFSIGSGGGGSNFTQNTTSGSSYNQNTGASNQNTGASNFSEGSGGDSYGLGLLQQSIQSHFNS